MTSAKASSNVELLSSVGNIGVKGHHSGAQNKTSIAIWNSNMETKLHYSIYSLTKKQEQGYMGKGSSNKNKLQFSIGHQ